MKRYTTIPPFLASPRAALSYIDKKISDVYLSEEEKDDRAYLYSDFAADAYRQGAIEVFRAVSVPVVDGRPKIFVNCLGKSWSRKPAGADTYNSIPWEGETRKVLLKGVVAPRDVDWHFGFTSFVWYGEEQWEVSMLANSPVVLIGIDEVRLSPPVKGNTGAAGEKWTEEECQRDTVLRKR